MKLQERENKIIGEDLCKFVQLLVDTEICGDIGEFYAAGQQCAKNATETTWGYASSVNINIDSMGSTLPNDTIDLKLKFSISIKGKTKNTEVLYDPIEELFFDIEVMGISKSNGNVFCSWHLDRHQPKNSDKLEHYSHPKYHFSFGGKKAEETDFYGSTLILPTPRFIYPPMDAVLGIDFIVQNYIHKNKRQALVTHSDYNSIVKKSQERLWKPFFNCILSNWQEPNKLSVEDDFHYAKLLPLIISN